MKYFYIFILIFFISCDNCERFYDNINKLESNLVVTKNLTENQSFPKVVIEGIDLETKNKTTFYTQNRMLIPISKHIKYGDTVIKMKDTPYISVYKKDSIIIHSFEGFCDNSINHKKDQENIKNNRVFIKKYFHLK